MVEAVLARGARGRPTAIARSESCLGGESISPESRQTLTLGTAPGTRRVVLGVTGAASDVHPFLRGTTMTVQRPTGAEALPATTCCTSHVERLTGPDIFEYSWEPYYVILFAPSFVDTGGNEAGRRKDPAVRGSAGDARWTTTYGRARGRRSRRTFWVLARDASSVHRLDSSLGFSRTNLVKLHSRAKPRSIPLRG